MSIEQQKNRDVVERVWRKAAHDLKNSFCIMQMNLAGVKGELSKVGLEPALADVEKEIKYCNWYIELMTMKVKDLSYESANLIEIGVKNCVDKALANFIPTYELVDRSRIKNQVEDFMVVGNMRLLLYILYNLLCNADYFTREVKNGEVILFSSADSNFNYLHLKDTGIGIAEENLPHIFEQYFTTEAGSMGLGLYFCKRAMQTMKGDITCQSMLGKFTEFVLCFPR